MDFIIGGTAAMGAGFFTNPLEVLKVRMQLQGELKSRGHHAVYYNNVIHAAYVVAKTEGVYALQKGLVPALYVQFVMNGARLGTYQVFEKKGFITDESGKIVVSKSILVGGFAGMIAQFISSPLSLVKTHLQNEAFATIAVGHQYHHKGLQVALKNVYSNYGIRGLFKGGWATLPRGYVASAAQLTSFNGTKQYLSQFEYYKDRAMLKAFLGAMVGGVAISFVVAPFDLVLVRLYNQPTDENGKGKMYKNYLDCVLKIYESEGVLAFYKGLGPIYFRLGPHSMLCLLFWEKLKSLYNKHI